MAILGIKIPEGKTEIRYNGQPGYIDGYVYSANHGCYVIVVYKNMEDDKLILGDVAWCYDMDSIEVVQ